MRWRWSQKVLHQCQDSNARKSQKSGDQNSDSIDREYKPRESGHGIYEPQAKKAAGRIDADFPEPPNGQRNDAKQPKGQKDGDEKRYKIYHRNLRIDRRRQHKITPDAEIQLFFKRDDGLKKRIVHLLSSVSP